MPHRYVVVSSIDSSFVSGLASSNVRHSDILRLVEIINMAAYRVQIKKIVKRASLRIVFF